MFLFCKRFTTSPNSNDRYVQYQDHHRYKDRGQYFTVDGRYVHAHQGQDMYHPISDRYVTAQERYAVNRPMVSTNPHAPVERYTPQQQDVYYQYDRYPKFSPNDPYMRRDLAFQYRITVPYQQGHLVQV